MKVSCLLCLSYEIIIVDLRDNLTFNSFNLLGGNYEFESVNVFHELLKQQKVFPIKIN